MVEKVKSISNHGDDVAHNEIKFDTPGPQCCHGLWMEWCEALLNWIVGTLHRDGSVACVRSNFSYLDRNTNTHNLATSFFNFNYLFSRVTFLWIINYLTSSRQMMQKRMTWNTLRRQGFLCYKVLAAPSINPASTLQGRSSRASKRSTSVNHQLREVEVVARLLSHLSVRNVLLHSASTVTRALIIALPIYSFHPSLVSVL